LSVGITERNKFYYLLVSLNVIIFIICWYHWT